MGDLDALDELSTEARLDAASGHGGDEAARIVERLRDDRPDDPFWRGVGEIRAEPDAVVVRFHEPIVPRDVQAERSRVRCHLHDPEPLARARQIRGRRAGPGQQ